MKRFLNKGNLTSGAAILLTGALAVSTVVFAAGGGPGGGGGGGGGMGGGAGNMGQIEMSESVISVKLQNPTTGSLTRSTEFIGKMEPAESVSVYPETSGKVTNTYYEVGQTVSKGDLLFTLDDSDAQLAYEIAQASYESRVISADTTLGSSYESNLLNLESSVKSSQQSLNSARQALSDYNDGNSDSLIRAEKASDAAYTKLKEAEQALESYKESADFDSTSQTYKDLYAAVTSANSDYSLAYNSVKDLEDDDDSTLRSLRNSYRSAQTNYETALSKYNLAQGGSLEDTKAATDAELKSANLSLEQSASNLDKYRVSAPISGVIETKNINAYETASAQTAAYVISNKDTMSVKFNASADAAAALNVGDTVTVTKSGTEYTATIIEINSKADSATGLFPIKARVEDQEGVLLSGLTVKVSAATQKAEDAILIPIDLVYYDEGQAYVFTYSDGKAHRVDITTGMSDSATTVVESGLTLNDQIITTWHPDLKDGATVELAEGQTSASDAKTAAASSEEAAPDGTAPEGTTPDEVSSKGIAPEGTAPEGTAPEGTAPEGAAPEGTASDEAAVPAPQTTDAGQSAEQED